MRNEFKKNEDAVSPVVGVMLMLVVTIIIAAVVSGFAGGLASGTQKAPQLTMDVKIKNTGYAGSSYILFDVQGMSEPIQTNDLKIVTSWFTNGTRGGTTVAGGLDYPNTNTTGNATLGTRYSYQSPLGFGKGVIGTQATSGQYPDGQHFGNYTLVPGTSMKNSAAGWITIGSANNYGYGAENRYEYRVYTTSSGSGWQVGDVDGMMAILGENWNATRPGDTVDLKVIHVPSGKVIFDKSVTVEG